MNSNPCNCWLLAGLLVLGTTAWSADSPSLKDAYKDHFYVGTAINRSMTTGTSFRRSAAQVSQDMALVQEQFNQLVAENDMKWELIHPRPGADGYDFGPADAFVNFGLSNHMYLVGHALVWHAQTPNRLFQGTNAPPGATNAVPPTPSVIPTAAPTNAPRRGRSGRGFGGGFPGRFTGPRASREELLSRMKGIYDKLLTDLNLKATDVPLIAGEVVGADQVGACAGMNKIIADLPKTIPTAHVVSATGCAALPDHLHFTPAGYRELGTRYGLKVLPLLGYQSEVAK